MFFKNLKPIFNYTNIPKLYKLLLLTFFGLLVEVISLAILFPVINFITSDDKIKYDYLIPKNLSLDPKNTLIWIVLLLLFIYLFRLVYMTYMNWKQNVFIQELSAKLINKLYSNYLYQKYTDTLMRDSSVYLKNIQVEMTTFTSGITAVFFLIVEFATIFSTFLVLLYFDPINTVIVTIYIFSVMFVFFRVFKAKIANLGLDRKIVTEKISFILNNSLSSLREILLNDVQGFFHKPFKKFAKKNAVIISTIATLNFLPRFVLEFVAVGAISFLVITYSLLDRLDSVIPLIAVFSAAGFRLIPSFNRIVIYVQQYRYSGSALELIFHDLEIDTFKYHDKFKKVPKKVEKFSKLEIQNITIRYPNTDQNVINNLSLELSAGKSIGIFGKSGSGKTTLLDVIIGLHKPLDGDVKMNNKSIYNNLQAWRNRIGYVSQDIQLLHDSILNNIAFGTEEDKIDLIKIKRVINESNIKEFVDSLSDGLETIIGERGVRLSGGQKQRIAIARALYKNPDILIFDEASSSLDVETEKNIMKEISFFKRRKTIIFVAHRLSTLANCDFVYELSNGKILNSGSPKDILKLNNDS